MAEYVAPRIASGRGAAKALRDLPGRSLVTTMEAPWRIVHKATGWTPDHVHFVDSMDQAAVEALDAALPPCDVVVGVGGGSSVDTAKWLAWKRGCRMVLVPTIVSVDAPLTNTVAVRVGNAVEYIADIFPQELIVDHGIIQEAPKALNRAGACDIASIHTALYDWKLAQAHTGENYDEAIAAEAAGCLAELDRNAAAVYDVSPEGIDCIIDLYRREVEFCARLGSSRPEEGSEHLVCYNVERIAKRHFIHGDLVALGIYAMSRLQENDHGAVLDLMRRTGLRYACPDASLEEIREALATLRRYKEDAGQFYSIVDAAELTDAYIEQLLHDLGKER